MAAYSFPISMRPKTKGMPDTVKELQGEDLERFAKLDFEMWLHEMQANGWSYGETYDEELQYSPNIRRYEELTEEEKEGVRKSLRMLPSYMNAVGLELYRKPFVK